MTLPAIGQIGTLENTKIFHAVKITHKVDQYGWGVITFTSNEGSFLIEEAVESSAYESIVDSIAVTSGFAQQVSIGCQYTVGRSDANFYSPMIPKCLISL